ncbi:dense granule protein gra9 [Cystoisospora suis]|uniref:Dense granule protein gra9 n=1 Tax=Cystoisospora suis TaxID=483139 RepID=A0A2C6L4T9_9APIC|nr:dense granule protein gra9 [Cystoisospora suis]
MRALKALLAPFSASLLFLSVRQDSGIVLAFAAEDEAAAFAVPLDPADPFSKTHAEDVVDVFGKAWGSLGDLGMFGDLTIPKLNLDDITSRMNRLFRSFFNDRSWFPESLFLKPKVKVHDDGRCRYVLAWERGVRAENIRVVLSFKKRTIGVVYREAQRRDEKSQTGESHSMSKEESQQFLHVNPECMMTPEVVAERLVGWTDNVATAAQGAAHKVLISFPSVDHLDRMVKEGLLPEDIVSMLQEGNVASLTAYQHCLASGRSADECEYAKAHEVLLKETPLPVTANTDSIELPRFAGHSGEMW